MQGKKHIILFSLSVLMMLSSCKDKMTQFHINYDTQSSHPVMSAQTVSFATPEIKTDCRVRFERNNTKRSKVKRIYIKKIRFYANDEKSSMLLLKIKAVYISSPDYAEQQISLKKSNEVSTQSEFGILLKDSDHNLIDFLKQDRFSMRFDFENNTGLPENMTADLEFFVEGELIKTNLYHKILV